MPDDRAGVLCVRIHDANRAGTGRGASDCRPDAGTGAGYAFAVAGTGPPGRSRADASTRAYAVTVTSARPRSVSGALTRACASSSASCDPVSRVGSGHR